MGNRIPRKTKDVIIYPWYNHSWSLFLTEATCDCKVRNPCYTSLYLIQNLAKSYLSKLDENFAITKYDKRFKGILNEYCQKMDELYYNDPRAIDGGRMWYNKLQWYMCLEHSQALKTDNSNLANSLNLIKIEVMWWKWDRGPSIETTKRFYVYVLWCILYIKQLENRPVGQIPQCTIDISHNVSCLTETRKIRANFC